MHSLLQAQSIILSQKSELKTLFESLIPDDFFEKRQRANAPKEKREEAAQTHRVYSEFESLANRHLSDIMNRES